MVFLNPAQARLVRHPTTGRIYTPALRERRVQCRPKLSTGLTPLKLEPGMQTAESRGLFFRGHISVLVTEMQL